MFKNKKQTQYAATTYQSWYNFDIKITKPKWLPLFFEQWLVPRFTINITNKGKDLDNGQLSCEILKYDDVSTFTSQTKNFKDFQHFRIKDFKNGQKLEYKCEIEARFIKPTNYMVKLMISKYEPIIESPYDSLLKQLKEIYKSDDNKIRHIISEIEKIHPIPKEIQQNESRVVPLMDFRLLEVIKVHPISTLVSFIGVLITFISILITILISTI